MCTQECTKLCVCVHALGAQVLTCVPGMCGVRGWQPEPAPPAPATPGSNPCSSSSQAMPWTQTQAIRGRGSRATDGALYPTPTAPRQVLFPSRPLPGSTHLGPGLPARNLQTRPVPRPTEGPLCLCAPSQPFPCSDFEGGPCWTLGSLSVTPAGKPLVGKTGPGDSCASALRATPTYT